MITLLISENDMGTNQNSSLIGPFAVVTVANQVICRAEIKSADVILYYRPSVHSRFFNFQIWAGQVVLSGLSGL